jgi:Protein of unknown function (DUF2905)
MTDVGRLVALLGLTLLIVGGGMMLLGRLNLPGDIIVQRGGLTFVFPVVACIVVSIVLTIVLNLLLRVL